MSIRLETLKELREIRNKYFSLLGCTFHHKNAQELAELSLNPKLSDLVEDYVHICLPEFEEEYKFAKREREYKEDLKAHFSLFPPMGL